MKNCKSFRKLISRYIDNDLSDTEKQMVLNHVSSCLECTEVLNAYSMLRKEIRNSCAIPVREKTLVAFNRSDLKFSRFPLITYSGVRLAAILIAAFVFIGGWQLFNTFPTSRCPIVLGHESSSMMNTPLCAIVYYEEFAGNAVNGQFTSFKTNHSDQEENDTSGVQTNLIGYESPLFHDNSLVQERYAMANHFSQWSR
jgi:hypothetical protein